MFSNDVVSEIIKITKAFKYLKIFKVLDSNNNNATEEVAKK